MSLERAASELEDGLGYAMHPRLAAHYERHIVDACGYCSHTELSEAAIAMGASTGLWLDLGAGSGLVGRALAGLGSSAELTAVDRSRAMLDLIEGDRYVARVHADCSSPLPLPSRTFAGALAAGLLEHLPDPGPLFDNVSRLVVPGGCFLFTYPPRGALSSAAPLSGGLVEHDVTELSAQLRFFDFRICSECEYPAYRNGSHGWVRHRLVGCQLGERSSVHAGEARA
jgi:SAM-dependent methyltransferase